MTGKPTVTQADVRVVQTILGILDVAVSVETYQVFQELIAAHREAAIKEAVAILKRVEVSLMPHVEEGLRERIRTFLTSAKARSTTEVIFHHSESCPVATQKCVENECKQGCQAASPWQDSTSAKGQADE